jgi:phosphotransferase system IIB component
MNVTELNNRNTRLDIVVHVDEQLDEQNRKRVEHAIIRAKGVERARFNNDRQHLLIIGYDSAQISSSKILKLVKKQQLNAQLVGGI